MTEKLKTLIIEDSKPIQVIYKVGLSDTIFEKRFEADGNTALEIYKSWRPDIIVLDLTIQGMSGFLLLKEIREGQKDAITTVVVASSLSDGNTVIDILKLGVAGYIVKPFTHKEIGKKILDSYKRMHPERAEEAFAVLNADREAPGAPKGR
ncbi:MAG: response regulator [Syntrophobacteraceae bacterium]|nr:response regulator [Syntrophobacteraceae bacterium]